MKILGYHTNNRNSLETHLSKLSRKLGHEYHKLRPALQYMTLEKRKIIVNAKVRTHLKYMLPLAISQPQYVRDRISRMLMKVNRWILQEKTFKLKNAKICKKIGMPTPDQEILQCSLKFFQNLVLTRKCKSLIELIRFPRRITSRLHHKYPKKVHFKTTLEHMTELFNQQEASIKTLSKPKLKRRLAKINIKYTRD